MPWQSQVIDYALARRATLSDVAHGRMSKAEACDAHPDLLRAARYYGEPLPRRCPICRKDPLTCVTYAYGDELQHASGRARSSRSLDALATRYAYLRVYVVEVCRACGWNHLTNSYVTGSHLSAGAVREPKPSDSRATVRRVTQLPDAVPVRGRRPPRSDPPAGPRTARR